VDSEQTDDTGIDWHGSVPAGCDVAHWFADPWECPKEGLTDSREKEEVCRTTS
jgi:hypothetical protein